MRPRLQARRTLIQSVAQGVLTGTVIVNEANACGLLEKETVESEHRRH